MQLAASSHAVAEGLALVWRQVDAAVVEGAPAAVLRVAGLGLGSSSSLHAVHVHRRATGHALLTIHGTLAVDITHAALVHRRKVTTGTEAVRAHAHPRLTAAHLASVTAVAAVLVEVLALQLVLNALAVRRVADKRQNRADAVDKGSTLLGVGVIECSL
jgi:hypothetical protein